MFDKPFDFDRFVRLLIALAACLAAYLLLRELSNVLLPFLLAWLSAYLLEPVVLWIKRLVKKRILAVAIVLLLMPLLLGAFLAFLIPAVAEEINILQQLLTNQLHDISPPAWLPDDLVLQVNGLLRSIDWSEVLASKGMLDGLMKALNGTWNLVSGVLGVFGALFGVVTYLLYLAFILVDYEKVSGSWKNLVPGKYRDFVFKLADDLEVGMNGYFKAQSKIVFFVAILFAIGFKLIGLPFAIVLGICLGLLNYIPYAQLIGIIPAVMLAALHALQNDERFWTMFLLVALVFTVVQLAQDLYLTPKFLGEFSGFNPAIILLSLSVWGALLGVVGIIIAIPLTSLLLAYYKRHVLNKSH